MTQIFESTVHDARHAARVLRKAPGTTTAALLTLALGIGANTAIFSLVDAVLLKPLPYPNAHRIVGMWETRPTGERNAMITRNYLAYASQGTVFEHIAATTGCCGLITLSDGPAPVELRALRVSSPYFDILGGTPALGRTFVAGDDQPGRDRVVVLSHALWSSQFGSNTALIGRPIRLDAESYTVVGVMPAHTPFDRSWVQLWLPLAFTSERMTRTDHWLLSPTGGALALMKPGVTLERARVEMHAISARLAADHPETNQGWGVAVEPYATVIVGKDLHQSLYLLVAAVAVVLLLACVNLANVMLSRGMARQREVAIRLALGARRGRVIQQFLTEAVLLSLAGGLLGVAVGYAILPLITAALPRYALPPEAAIALDARVLMFTFVLSVLSGITFGLAAALGSTRPTARASVGLHRLAGMRDSHQGLRSVLVVAEVALAFVLLTGAGLLIRSVFKMQHADTGFTTTNLLTAYLPIKEHRFSDPEQLTAYLGRIAAAIKSLPGVHDVALTDGLPFQGVPTGMFFQIVGRPVVERARRPVCDFKTVSGSYFQALGLRMRKGRSLSDRDRRGSPYVTVINETMARRYFPQEDAVGQHIVMQVTLPDTTEEAVWEIVGIIADERLTPFDDKREHPAAYVTNEQSRTLSAGLVMRTALDATRIEESVRRAVSNIDKEQVITALKTVDQIRSESMASDRLRSSLLGVFAIVALLLAAIGLYGIISHSVVQRTHEIGIRAALGATAGDLVRLVLRHGMTLTGTGLVVGFVSAFGATRLLSTFLFGVGSSDPITLGVTAGILAAVAAVACYIPAWGATRVDPLVALRAE
jgi:putative ABC transport system permease protein